MSERSPRRRLSILIVGIGCAVVLPVIAVVVPSVFAASPAPLFSVLGHDALAKSTSPCSSTQIGLYGCEIRKLRTVDKQLDVTAAQIIAADGRIDTGGPTGLSTAQATKFVSAAQRTWLAFRNADCLVQIDEELDGTGVGLANATCAVADGRTRLAALQHDLKAIPPGD